MADTFTGKFSFDKGKWKIVFFDEAKQKDSTLFCQKNVFASDFEPNEGEETEVSFERDTTPQKNAIKVRAKDAEWQESAPVVRAAPIDGGERNAPRNQRDDRQRQPNNPTRRENMPNKPNPEFHNPYNFVPAIPRDHIDSNTNDLGDREPSGHDRYLAHRFSGKLSVHMRVETPLLLPDTAQVGVGEIGDSDHKSFPVRVKPLLNDDGNPVIKNGQVVLVPDINPTAIKGMLRSAYEAITNSRLSVFKDHNERLAFRMDAGDALKLVPARIKNEKVFLYIGNTQMEDNGVPVVTRTIPRRDGRDAEIREMYAAWLGEYKGHGNNYNGLDEHEKEVWAFITKWQHRKFDFWNVIELRDGDLPEPKDVLTDTSRQGEWIKGYVCKTNRNIESKHDERVFFMPKGQNPIEAKVADFDTLRKEWKRLIENYGEIHVGEDPPKDDRNRNRFEWSSFIKNPKSYKDLKDRTLCYAKVKKIGKNDWQVLELLPVMISRRLHEVPPDQLLADYLKPVSLIEKVEDKDGTHLSEMSPADRVFGCVRQKRKDEKGKDKNFTGNIPGYRGQVRIGAVECVSNQADAIKYFDKALPLQILGQPKPQQGRFYVAETQNGEAQTQKRNNEDAGFKKNQNRGLRGRKVYPHHANLPEDYWIDPTNPNLETSKKEQGFYKEYRRRRRYELDNSIEQRDSQNRSIQGWVTSNTGFMFDIHFTNLSSVELGALVWLLVLPETHFHRFGGGKPLGFGSVHMSIEGSEILAGKELRKKYLSLDYTPTNSIIIEKCKERFIDSVNLAYPKAKLLEVFEQAAKGFADNLPTHYPRTRHYKLIEDNQGNKIPEFINNEDEPLPPHEDGLAYEWFVANNQMQGRQIKYGFVLPSLIDENGKPDDGLAILTSEVKEKTQNNRSQNRNSESLRNRGGRRR